MSDDPTTHAGYRAHTRARSTGTLVVLYDGVCQGAPVEDGGRWLLICDGPEGGPVHGGVCQFTRQQDALGWLSHPDQWCPICQGDDPT